MAYKIFKKDKISREFDNLETTRDKGVTSTNLLCELDIFNYFIKKMNCFFSLFFITCSCRNGLTNFLAWLVIIKCFIFILFPQFCYSNNFSFINNPTQSNNKSTAIVKTIVDSNNCLNVEVFKICAKQGSILYRLSENDYRMTKELVDIYWTM